MQECSDTSTIAHLDDRINDNLEQKHERQSPSSTRYIHVNVKPAEVGSHLPVHTHANIHTHTTTANVDLDRKLAEVKIGDPESIYERVAGQMRELAERQREEYNIMLTSLQAELQGCRREVRTANVQHPISPIRPIAHASPFISPTRTVHVDHSRSQAAFRPIVLPAHDRPILPSAHDDRPIVPPAHDVPQRGHTPSPVSNAYASPSRLQAQAMAAAQQAQVSPLLHTTGPARYSHSHADPFPMSPPMSATTDIPGPNMRVSPGAEMALHEAVMQEDYVDAALERMGMKRGDAKRAGFTEQALVLMGKALWDERIGNMREKKERDEAWAPPRVPAPVTVSRERERPLMSRGDNQLVVFDGEKQEPTLENWLKRVEICARMYGWDDTHTVGAMFLKAKGGADTIIQRVMERLGYDVTYAEARDALLASYGVKEKGIYTMEYRQRQQKESEDVSEYGRALAELAAKAGTTNPEEPCAHVCAGVSLATQLWIWRSEHTTRTFQQFLEYTRSVSRATSLFQGDKPHTLRTPGRRTNTDNALVLYSGNVLPPLPPTLTQQTPFTHTNTTHERNMHKIIQQTAQDSINHAFLIRSPSTTSAGAVARTSQSPSEGAGEARHSSPIQFRYTCSVHGANNTHDSTTCRYLHHE